MRGPGAVHHRGGRDPRLRAEVQPRAPRVPRRRGQRPLQVVPGVGDRAAGAGLAAARPDREQRDGGGPRDPHQVPDLPRPPSPQGGLALPPAPRGLRPVRHALLLLHRRRGRPPGAGRHQVHGHGVAFRVPRHLHDLPQRGRPAPPLQRPLRGDSLSPSPSPRPLPLRRLRRLPLLCRTARPAEAARPGDRRDEPGAERGAAQDRRGGAARSRAAQADPRPGVVSADELVELYAGCRAAYYAPLNEDYGYVTVEAFLSRKPVVTTTDAGGPLEFVTAGQSGWVAEPAPEAIAGAIDDLWSQPEARLREMGAEGFARVRDIGWNQVIDRLTEGL
ncbi:MAG: hypothetical protein DMF81_16445 [Acidobacteria bacterium]|nr:MAG: hypothetical protein DMF81_16445 [Acidobacteriota bacterium]